MTKNLLGLFLLISIFSANQLQGQNAITRNQVRTLTGIPTQTNFTGNFNGGGGMQFFTTTCGFDTVRYPLQKATALIPYSASPSQGGMAVGQWYPAPQSLTISGIEFFAWVDSSTNQTAVLTGAVYAAGPDSLPTGAPLGTGTITIDSNFYGGNVLALRKVITFNSPVVTSSNYVVTVTNGSNLALGIIGNDTINGIFEDLAEIFVSIPPVINGWQKLLSDLAIANADFLIHPIVRYDLTSSFTAAPNPVCSGQSVTFTNSSSPIFTSRFYNLDYFPPPTNRTWLWNFGNGSPTVRTQNATYSYPAAGTFNASLLDTMFTWSTAAGFCRDTSAVSITVLSGSPPVAAFSSSINQNTATFTNTSSGATTYLWNFGDGNTSSVANPSHTYANSGTYTVCLTATNACSLDSVCHQVTVSCVPVAAIYTFVTNNLSVNFTNSSTGNPVSYFWSFGDGTNSTQVNPSHTYATPAQYQVCLTAISLCDTHTTCQTVSVTCPSPVPSFNFVTYGPNVVFTATATNNPTTWLWNFGDGGTTNTQNPIHSYSAVGTYNVCLTTTSMCGTNQVCRSVIVTCVGPTAGFGFSISSDSIIVVSNQSSPNTTGYTWTFGDGYSTTQMNPPAHTYSAPGTYTICLYITNQCGADTFCQNVVITCTNLVTAGYTSSQVGGSVLFFNSSLFAQRYLWDFGDGTTDTVFNPNHSFPQSGTYLVCLTSTNYCGSNTFCLNVVVQCMQPVPNFTSSQGNALVTYTDQSINNPTTWYWTLGDGATDTVQNPAHGYLYPGYYRVCLYATNSCGTQSFCDTVQVVVIGVEPDWASQVLVYPNPVNEALNVQLPEGSGNLLGAHIADLNGKLILDFTPSSAQPGQTIRINTSNLSKGLYFLRVETTEGKLVRKVLVD